MRRVQSEIIYVPLGCTFLGRDCACVNTQGAAKKVRGKTKKKEKSKIKFCGSSAVSVHSFQQSGAAENVNGASICGSLCYDFTTIFATKLYEQRTRCTYLAVDHWSIWKSKLPLELTMGN
ncbi:uncharacterized protein [Eurosta solidaginis]|uniref:uncharacterized protein n=1 Tax=Eurosta solidaginis TaxID=178769 RepID=UPI0035306746